MALRYKHKHCSIRYHLSKSETEKQPTAQFAYGHLRVHFEATNLKKKNRASVLYSGRFSQKFIFVSRPSKTIVGVTGPHSQSSFKLSRKLFFFYFCSNQGPWQ